MRYFFVEDITPKPCAGGKSVWINIKFPANTKQADVIVLPEVKSHNERRQFRLQSAIYGVGQEQTKGPLEEVLNRTSNQR